MMTTEAELPVLEPTTAPSRAPRGTPRAAPEPVPEPVEARASARARRRSLGDAVLLAGVALLVGSAWTISRLQLFKSGDDISYWIAVVGGSMMLALLSYPLRKYMRFAQGWGRVKWWFWGHMVLGIGGPWLILVHSTFQLGSMNATVAMYSMLIVVGSGIVGRFIYVRVHRGLDGELVSLKALQTKAGMVESEARSWLRFAPEVEQRLVAFEQRALREDTGWLGHLRQVFVLPVLQFFTWRACVRALHLRVGALAADAGWDAAVRARREKRSRRFVTRYLNAVVRCAQYTAYERLFALWHVAHLPFVFLLVISAVVHVIAVHAY